MSWFPVVLIIVSEMRLFQLGIGPRENGGTASFRLPSKTFTNELMMTAAGIHMKLVWVPSETDDELAIFVSDQLNFQEKGGVRRAEGSGLLLSAEVIQGPAFPNLYSLRGTSYRSPANWFNSVDVLRKMDPWCMVPSHGPPLCGKPNIQLLLRNFRDAIQYTHDQTVRFMNKGYTPEEMASYLVQLPKYLIQDLEALKPALPSSDMNPFDYLLPLYGSLPQSVREIYFGYLGWYTADPVNLKPTPPKQLSTRYVAQMGGRDSVLKAAEDALKKGEALQEKSEYQWAAELATHLVRVNPDDRAARNVKAMAYLKLAQPLDDGSSSDWRNWDIRSIDPNWRNWFLTSMIELSQPKDWHFPALLGKGLVSTGIISNLPPSAWVKSWTFRLQAEKTMLLSHTVSMGFHFPADPHSWPGVGAQRFVLEIRKAVAEFTEVQDDSKPFWNGVDVAINITREQLKQLLEFEAKVILAQYIVDKQIIPGVEVTLEDVPPLKYSPPQTSNPLADALVLQAVQGSIPLLAGTVESLKIFLSYFDPPLSASPYLSTK